MLRTVLLSLVVAAAQASQWADIDTRPAGSEFVFRLLDAPENLNYGLIIDAGSTGSRIYAYSWPKNLTTLWSPPYPLPVTQSGWSFKSGTPLASLTPATLNASLSLLISWGVNFTNQFALDPSQIPLYLGATAGVRMLPAASRQSLMDAVRAYFSNSSTCPFMFAPHHARVLSGEEEGFYGWLSVNYLTGNLETIGSAGGASWTSGAMDLGGASTQLTFSGSDLLDSHVPFNYGNVYVDIYAKSFLHFGINELYLSVAKLIVANGAPYNHPCYATGLSVPTTVNGVSYTMIGMSNYSGCHSYIQQVLNLNSPCLTTGECSVSGAYLPAIPSNVTFYAMSSFPSVVNGMNMGTTTPTPTELSTKAQTMCGLDYATLNATFGTYNGPFLNTACMSAVYISTLLLEAYHFDPNARQINYVTKLANADLTWTTGGLLYQANLIPGYTPPCPTCPTCPTPNPTMNPTMNPTPTPSPSGGETVININFEGMLSGLS